MDVATFIFALHQNGTHTNYWTSDGRRSLWRPVGDPQPPDLAGQADWYFGVHPLREVPTTDSNGSPKSPEFVRSRAELIDCINCLFAEFDGKDFDAADPRGEGKRLARERIEALDRRPSIIVDSGGGYHCYWLLRGTLQVDDGNRREVQAVQNAWVALVGGDENASDLARVLRIPGTVNGKYDDRPTVTIVAMDVDCRYVWGDFTTLVSALLTSPSRSRRRKKSPQYTVEQAEEWLDVLESLDPDDYFDWIKVGFALHELGDPGLELWKRWSQQSSKYAEGQCEEKWRTISDDRDNRFTLHGLVKVASLDLDKKLSRVHKVSVPPNPQPRRNVTTLQIRQALEATYQYIFRRNEATGLIEVNGRPMSTEDYKIIYGKMVDIGFHSFALLDSTISTIAEENKYHPVQDYLRGLRWNGQDNIAALAAHFTENSESQGLMGKWLRRWMVGAVNRAFSPRGAQNYMLVLEGPQGIGKSYFAEWLCSGIPAHFVSSGLQPDSKDCQIRAGYAFIWEVGELGATIRRQDVEALKNFISTTTFSVRRPYARQDTPIVNLASLIGTINDTSGFYNDPTGTRRFLTVGLDKIDFAYAQNIDPNQVWAQAVELFWAGAEWTLDSEETEMQRRVNEGYRMADAIEDLIDAKFEIDPTHEDWVLPRLEVFRALTREGESMQRIQTRVGTYLKTRGVKSARKAIDGRLVRVYLGIKKSFEEQQFDKMINDGRMM